MDTNQLILIAGPNGSGKTMGAFVLLPDFFQENEFVNADEIAKGLSPLKPDSMHIRAGKLMLRRIKELLDNDKSFGVETTLSGFTYKFLIESAKLKNYEIGIIFLYLSSSSLAKKRVEERVTLGGHGIPLETIERRYQRGIQNFIHVYLPMADWCYVLDSSFSVELESKPIYIKSGEDAIVANQKLWERIHDQAGQVP